MSTHGSRTRAAIVEAGLAIMRDDPGKVSARRIGKALGLTHSAVLYHFSDAAGLHDALAAEAVERRDGRCIVYLIATRHASVANLSDAERAGFMRAG